MKSDFIDKLRLYVITDSAKLAELVLEGGAMAIQYREKGKDTLDLVKMGREIKELCDAHNAIFIVNDRIDVALATDADGVHLGTRDMPLDIARGLLGSKIIGASASSVDEAMRAQEQADYIGFGSIFPTGSKGDAVVTGIDPLKEIKRRVSKPIVAIGGITQKNVGEVAGIADGVAVISAVSSAKDPTIATRELLEKLKGQS